MFKFKKVLSMIVLALIIAVSSVLPAFAQARYGVQTTGAYEISENLILPAGTWVYGVRLYADESSSVAVVYNAATFAEGEADITLKIDELGEATQYNSQFITYPKPIYCENGVSVGITLGIMFVYYGPEPTTR